MEARAGIHIRALSDLRKVSWERPKSTLRAFMSPGLAGFSLDEALKGVRRDMKALWLRSRYIRDFPGIITQAIQPKENKKSLFVEIPSVKATVPFQVTVHAKRKPRNAVSLLKVASPAAVFPVAKRSQPYATRRIPQPLFLHRRGIRVTSNKAQVGRKEGHMSQFSERDSTDNCPLTALRSFEWERNRDLRAFSSYHLSSESLENQAISASPRLKTSLLMHPLQLHNSPEKMPVWNEDCLKVMKVTPIPSHRKTTSHPAWQFSSSPAMAADYEGS